MLDITKCKIYDAPYVDKKDVGRRLRELRLRNDVKIKLLQEYFDFNYPNAIYDWESGKKLPDIDNLANLARIYGVPMEEILFGDKVG